MVMSATPLPTILRTFRPHEKHMNISEEYLACVATTSGHLIVIPPQPHLGEWTHGLHVSGWVN